MYTAQAIASGNISRPRANPVSPELTSRNSNTVLQSLFRILSPLLGGLLMTGIASAAPQSDKQILGLHEHVRIVDLGVELKAKLDTGATTSSLSARNIQRFKRDGESWVRFQLAYDKAPKQVYELPLARVSRIKRRADDFDPEEEKTYSARPVIELTLHVGKRQQAVEVNLTDRSAFKYPFLLGASGLEALGIIVDPALRLTAGKPVLPNTDNRLSE